jgi:hypothetical protein
MLFFVAIEPYLFNLLAAGLCESPIGIFELLSFKALH